MPNLEIAGANIALPLGDANPAYAQLIATEQAQAAEIESIPVVYSGFQTVHTDLWTTDEGVEWSSPANAGLAERRDRALGRLAGTPLLDLGCGAPNSYEPLRRFVQPYGPTAYIGVNNVASLVAQPFSTIPGFGNVLPIPDHNGTVAPGVVVRGDMLEVLSRLPDGSVNVALNGVDEYMVETNEPYGQAVAAEIVRVTRPDGLVFGVTKNAGLLALLAASGKFAVDHISLVPNPRSTPPYIPGSSVQDGYYFMTKPASQAS